MKFYRLYELTGDGLKLYRPTARFPTVPLAEAAAMDEVLAYAYAGQEPPLLTVLPVYGLSMDDVERVETYFRELTVNESSQRSSQQSTVNSQHVD